jgi:hypothetical protein
MAAMTTEPEPFDPVANLLAHADRRYVVIVYGSPGFGALPRVAKTCATEKAARNWIAREYPGVDQPGKRGQRRVHWVRLFDQRTGKELPHTPKGSTK